MSGPLSENVQVPILIANSEVWSAEPADLYGQDYFTAIKGIAETSLGATNAGWFMTLLGTAHVSITDAGLIAGQSLLAVFDPGAANATLEPAVAIDNYVNASVEFFRFLKTNTTAGILATNVTDPEYVQRAANTSSGPWEIHVAPVAK
jgi:platelet-activating factor acetylhydrolase